MRDLLRDALDATALLVEVGARFVADAMTERRKAFDDDEAGDYLRCAGADALAESLARCDPDVYGTAVLQPHGLVDFVAEASAADPRAADDSAAVVPPPEATAAESPTCKHCGQPIELFVDEHPHLGRAAVWLHVLGDGRTRVACELTYASPQ